MVSEKKMSKEEILRQLPDDFGKLASVKRPPPISDFEPSPDVVRKRTPLLEKIFHNPLVPLGLVATVGFLANGLRHLKNKNSYKQQLMMRGRVLAQAFTILALVGGVWLEAKWKKPTESTE